jgi:hypothetical protein
MKFCKRTNSSKNIYASFAKKTKPDADLVEPSGFIILYPEPVEGYSGSIIY